MPFSGSVSVLFRDALGQVTSQTKWSAASAALAGGVGLFDNFGAAVVGVGDLDLDGVPDAAVGAPGDGDGGSGRGALWIVFAAANGTIKAVQKISDTSGGFLGGLADGDAFGSALASVGDLDGDGIQDLAVGAPGDDDGGDDAGAVWVLLLARDGTVREETKISARQGALAAMPGAGDRFGAALGAPASPDPAMSFDLAVGAPGSDGGGSDRGALHLLRLDRASCGNGEAEYAESCDDGDPVDANGCSNACTPRDSRTLFGEGEGGSLTLTIGGVAVTATTTLGQSADAAAAALAAAVAADPTLSMLGITASSAGGAVVVEAAIDAFSVDDPGFMVFVPALPAPSLGLLAALLGGLGALGAARRRR